LQELVHSFRGGGHCERENKKGEKRHKDIKVIKQMRKRERER
jgi:hypothetical protein